MSSHSGKKAKRKAREAERYWRLKEEYDDRITKLEERRRQIMEQLDPGSHDLGSNAPGSSFPEAKSRRPHLSRLKENLLRVRDALEEVIQVCDSISSEQSFLLKPAVGDSCPLDLNSEKPSGTKKSKVLVFNSDGTLKGQLKGKRSASSQGVGEYLPEIGRLRNSAGDSLQVVEELLVLLGEEPGSLPSESQQGKTQRNRTQQHRDQEVGTQEILPPETAGNQEDGDIDGMLEVLKSPMVADLISSLLTSIKK